MTLDKVSQRSIAVYFAYKMEEKVKTFSRLDMLLEPP